MLHLYSFQKLEGMHNYNPAYIEGSRKLSSFKDHAARTMHVWAMSLCLAKNKNVWAKSQLDLPGYHPIVNSSTAVCVGVG